jgi:transglutaminase-like putative cysteine protease
MITDEHNNKIAHFFVNLTPGKASEVSIVVLVELNNTSYTIPSNSATYDSASPIFQEYTKPEKYVESDNPMIMEVVRNITSGYSDPLNASMVICTWVNQNLNYSGFSTTARGALWALKNKNGDCSEYSDLFIALCRARGIPARFIDGIKLWSVNSSGTQSWEKIGHDWVEVYFQNIGWVWVDPTSGQFACSDGQHMAIQLGQYCSSLSGSYRYYFSGNANVTERFELYPQAE